MMKQMGKAQNLGTFASPDKLVPPPVHVVNPFGSRVERGYNHYVDDLEGGRLKNNSNHMKSIFSSSDKQFELPRIARAQNPAVGGAVGGMNPAGSMVVINRKSLDKIQANAGGQY